MNIYIEKPFSINEIGGRINNEDTILPEKGEASVNDKLFLVCDGVGGANKGEVASSLACESIRTYFNTFVDLSMPFTPDLIDKAIRYTEIRFDDYLLENPSAKGMGTTLSLLYITSNGVYIAHAGDSRIYQVRNGKVLLKTEDHSLVNSLIKNGKISPENAQKHPQRNVILRAIQSSKFPVEVDITHIDDIMPGDQFLMCTDGIFETLNESEICSILHQEDSTESKMLKIKEICTQNSTKDNYSAYLIQIHDVQESHTFKQIFASFLYAFM